MVEWRMRWTWTEILYALKLCSTGVVGFQKALDGLHTQQLTTFIHGLAQLLTRKMVLLVWSSEISLDSTLYLLGVLRGSTI